MTNRSDLKQMGFDIVINGANKYFSDFELSAIACAGFYKEHHPADEVKIRTRADGTSRMVLGPARLESSD
jgi:hypothetical protein